MRSNMNKLFRLAAASILIIVILALAACSGGSGPGVQIGSPAPDFTLRDLNGQSISLSNFLGKAVLINFWSTTCPPCVEEMPYFEALHQDWENRNDIVLITVNMGEDSTRVKNFIQSKNYTFPVLLDGSFEAAQKYRVQYTPTTVLIGKDGTVKFSISGPFKDKAAIEKQVAGYL